MATKKGKVPARKKVEPKFKTATKEVEKKVDAKVETTTKEVGEKVETKKIEKLIEEVQKKVDAKDKTVTKELEKKVDAMHIRAKEVFKSHNDSVKEIYFTSDGTAFIQNQHARMHGESLKDTEVKTVKRTEV